MHAVHPCRLQATRPHRSAAPTAVRRSNGKYCRCQTRVRIQFKLFAGRVLFIGYRFSRSPTIHRRTGYMKYMAGLPAVFVRGPHNKTVFLRASLYCLRDESRISTSVGIPWAITRVANSPGEGIRILTMNRIRANQDCPTCHRPASTFS